MWLGAERVEYPSIHTQTQSQSCMEGGREAGRAFQEPGWLQIRNRKRKAVPIRVLVTHTQKKGGPEAKMDMFPSPDPYVYDSSIHLNMYA